MLLIGTKPMPVTLMTRVPINENRNLYWWKLKHISKVTYCQKYQMMIACLNNVSKETIKLCDCCIFSILFRHFLKAEKNTDDRINEFVFWNINLYLLMLLFFTTFLQHRNQARKADKIIFYFEFVTDIGLPDTLPRQKLPAWKYHR